MLIIVVIILISAICYKYNSEENKRIREYMINILNEKCDFECNVKYKGGNPELCESGIYRLKIFNNKIRLCQNFKDEFIEINSKDILSFEKMTNSQIYNNPKLSSILALGVVGLGLNNNSVRDTYSFVINRKYKDKEIDFVIEPNNEKDFSNIYSKLNFIT